MTTYLLFYTSELPLEGIKEGNGKLSVTIGAAVSVLVLLVLCEGRGTQSDPLVNQHLFRDGLDPRTMTM